MINLVFGTIIAIIFAVKYCRKGKVEKKETKSSLVKDFKEAMKRQKVKTTIKKDCEDAEYKEA